MGNSGDRDRGRDTGGSSFDLLDTQRFRSDVVVILEVT